jgi:hypothetical protein
MKKFPQKKSFFLTKTFILSLFLAISHLLDASEIRWGFWAHRRINRLAVFRLPPEMITFYKKHIDYLTENAVNPDKRRYAVVGEAERHFIDLDVYGDSALYILPKNWRDAKLKIGEDSLRKHGIAPWQVQLTAQQLTAAFRTLNASQILRISADLGHYVADSHVPLHTTRNYNGQLTDQVGIHAFWESRIPELKAQNYDLWIGTADYLQSPSEAIWNAVTLAHRACDSVLIFEKQLTSYWPEDKKYSYETRNGQLVRVYSNEFTVKYDQMIEGQVERQMKAAIKMVGDLWYTCWVNAGQPNLASLYFSTTEEKEEAVERRSWIQRLFNVRKESDDG